MKNRNRGLKFRHGGFLGQDVIWNPLRPVAMRTIWNQSAYISDE